MKTQIAIGLMLITAAAGCGPLDYGSGSSSTGSVAGIQGPAGPQGAPGMNGNNGAPGADGANGADGADGTDGLNALTGDYLGFSTANNAIVAAGNAIIFANQNAPDGVVVTHPASGTVMTVNVAGTYSVTFMARWEDCSTVGPVAVDCRIDLEAAGAVVANVYVASDSTNAAGNSGSFIAEVTLGVNDTIRIRNSSTGAMTLGAVGTGAALGGSNASVYIRRIR